MRSMQRLLIPSRNMLEDWHTQLHLYDYGYTPIMGNDLGLAEVCRYIAIY